MNRVGRGEEGGREVGRERLSWGERKGRRDGRLDVT